MYIHFLSKKHIVQASLLVALVVVAIWLTYRATQPKQDKALSLTNKLAISQGNNLYLANPNSFGLVRIAQAPNKDSIERIEWSPDGKRIAYHTGDLIWGDGKLFVLNANGTDHKFLIDLAAHVYWGWSPDSQYVYTMRCHNMCEVAVTSIETGQKICIAESGATPYSIAAGCEPFQLTDGKWWSVSRHVVVNGDDKKWILAEQYQQSLIASPRLSPDQKWVALVCIQTDSSDGTSLSPTEKDYDHFKSQWILAGAFAMMPSGLQTRSDSLWLPRKVIKPVSGPSVQRMKTQFFSPHSQLHPVPFSKNGQRTANVWAFLYRAICISWTCSTDNCAALNWTLSSGASCR